MESNFAAKLIAFANSHDDGTAQPRAYFDGNCDAVIVKSTAVWPNGDSAIELDSVRSFAQLRDVLGY